MNRQAIINPFVYYYYYYEEMNKVKRQIRVLFVTETTQYRI